jgi:hypothetical protein
MQAEKLPTWMILGGMALLAFSFLWPRMVGGKVSYTQEDAKEYLRASEELHNRIHGHGADHADHAHHPSAEAVKSDPMYQAAWNDYNKAVAKRDAAVNRGKTTAAIAKWLGIVTAIVGVIMFAARQKP